METPIDYLGTPIGYYPLWMQNSYSPLPDEIPYQNQPINIIFCHTREIFDVQNIISFVKFQYNESQLLFQTPPLSEDYSIDVIQKNTDPQTQLNLDRFKYGVIIEYDKDDYVYSKGTHLQESMNMLFS